jgi:hypothetical protein
VINPVFSFFKTFGDFGLSILLLTLCTFAKVYCTFVNLLIHPFEALGSIPSNWRRVVLCTDSATVPELIPGIEQYRTTNTLMEGAKFSVNFKLYKAGFISNALDIYWHAKYLTIMIPAVTYRLSLKSTALVWSPLIWVVRPVTAQRDAFSSMRYLLKRGLSALSRGYSAVIMALFAGKIYLFFNFFQLSAKASEFPGWNLFSKYIVPERIAFWQVAAFINAMLTWLLYLVADHFWHEHTEGSEIPESTLAQVFTSVFMFRNILSVYTAICTLYITALAASQAQWPAFKFEFAPW